MREMMGRWTAVMMGRWAGEMMGRWTGDYLKAIIKIEEDRRHTSSFLLQFKGNNFKSLYFVCANLIRSLINILAARLEAEVQDIMAGDHSNKRKAPMSPAALEAEKEGKAHLKAILFMVREQMKAKEDAHRVELQLERIAGKLEMLEEMMDMEAKRQRLEEEKEKALEELRGINIPPIDWDKMNLGFMLR